MDNAPVADDGMDMYASPAAQDMQFERMREIRLSVTLSDTRIPEGHYYLVDFDVPKGDKPKHTDLGTDIIIHVLRHAMKARKWDQEMDMNVIDSSEFRTFNDVVVLYDVYSIPNKIIAALPYTHRNKALPCIGGKGENALKKKLGLSVRYVSYVLYNGEICRMNFTATDNSGADQDDKPLPFGKEAVDSFSGFLHSLDETERSKSFLFDVKLGAKKNQIGTEKVMQDGKQVEVPIFSKKIVLKTFVSVGRVDTAMETEIKAKLNALYSQLSEQFWNKYTKAREATDINKLDAWSQKILEKIDDVGTDPLLYSKSEQVKTIPEKGEVIDVKMIASPDTTQERQAQDSTATTAADLGGEAKSASATSHPVIDMATGTKEVFGSASPGVSQTADTPRSPGENGQGENAGG